MRSVSLDHHCLHENPRSSEGVQPYQEFLPTKYLLPQESPSSLRSFDHSPVLSDKTHIHPDGSPKGIDEPIKGARARRGGTNSVSSIDRKFIERDDVTKLNRDAKCAQEHVYDLPWRQISWRDFAAMEAPAFDGVVELSANRAQTVEFKPPLSVAKKRVRVLMSPLVS